VFDNAQGIGAPGQLGQLFDIPVVQFSEVELPGQHIGQRFGVEQDGPAVQVPVFIDVGSASVDSGFQFLMLVLQVISVADEAADFVLAIMDVASGSLDAGIQSVSLLSQGSDERLPEADVVVEVIQFRKQVGFSGIGGCDAGFQLPDLLSQFPQPFVGFQGIGELFSLGDQDCGDGYEQGKTSQLQELHVYKIIDFSLEINRKIHIKGSLGGYGQNPAKHNNTTGRVTIVLLKGLDYGEKFVYNLVIGHIVHQS
jgi:hypothetical protein